MEKFSPKPTFNSYLSSIRSLPSAAARLPSSLEPWLRYMLKKINPKKGNCEVLLKDIQPLYHWENLQYKFPTVLYF